MTDRRSFATMPDVDLEAALRDLGRAIAWPDPAGRSGTTDPAALARRRIVNGDAMAAPSRWGGLGLARPGRGGWRPLRRAVLLALLAIAVIAAIATAIGFGLPGIRFVAAPPSSSPIPGASSSASAAPIGTATASPTSGGSLPVGWSLGLGAPVDPANLAGVVGFQPILPPRGTVGSPTGAWVLDGRLSLIWPVRSGAPATSDREIGLLLTEFRGSIDPGYFQKIIGPNTRITSVAVGGGTGYWLSGDPHEIVFVDPSGRPDFDSRQSIGDTLLWTRGDVTLRLESGLDEAHAIALAESMR